MVIKSQGAWIYREAGAVRSLTVTPSNGRRVHWDFGTYRSGPVRPSGGKTDAEGKFDLPSPTSPWFIYVESTDRLWFCDGTAKLSYRIWNSTVEQGGDAILDGALKEGSEPVPAEVIQLLPADLQKLFATGSTKPRPSI